MGWHVNKGQIIRIVLFCLCASVYLWHITGHLLISTGLQSHTDIAAVIAAHQDKEYNYVISNAMLPEDASKLAIKVYAQETFYVVQSRLSVKNIPINPQHLDLLAMWLPREQMISDALQCIKDSNNKNINGTLEVTYDDKCRLSGIKSNLDVLGISCRIHAHVDHQGFHSEIAAPALSIIDKSSDSDFDADNVHSIPLLLPGDLRVGQELELNIIQKAYALKIEIGPQESVTIGKRSMKLMRASVLYNSTAYASMWIDTNGVVYRLSSERSSAVLNLDSIKNASGDKIWMR